MRGTGLARGRAELGLLLVASLLAAADRAHAEDPPEASYRISLEVNRETGEIKGASEIALLNSSSRPLGRLPLLLYANRFRVQDPAIDDTNFERYYSYRFHPGEMRLGSIRDASGKALELSLPAVPGMPSGTYAEVVLEEPVAPGKEARVRVEFVVRVPDRFGMFGRRGSRVVLEGGAWPLVPARSRSGAFEPSLGAMRASHEISATAPSGEVVLAGVATVDSRGVFRTTAVAPTVFLGAGDDLSVIARRSAEPGAGIPEIVYRGPEGEEKKAARILGLVSQAAQRFSRDWLPDEPLEPIVIVEAPLRDRLVHACSVLLVSDRIFEVFPILDGFHEREIQRATFELLARRSRALASVEGPDAAWIAEAIAWVALEQWENDRGGLKGGDVRAGLGILDFIPLIDNALRAPRFASSDVYFGRLYEPRENVRDELDRLGSSRPRGRVLAEKLRDKMGTEKLRSLALATLGRTARDGSRLRERASRLAGEDLTGFFDLWLGPPPRENLKIASRDAATLPDGREGIAISVERETEDARIGRVGEPVTIELRSGGKRERQVWDGRGDASVLYFSRDGFYSVEIDPEGRIDELTKDDNFWPSIAKILVNRFKFSIDLNGGHRSSVDAGLTVHPLYAYAHSILLDGFYGGDGRGVRIAYAYSFGQRIDEVTFGSSLAAAFRYESLATGLLRNAPIAETTGRLATYGLSWGIETRTDGLRPTHGFHLGVAGDLADPRFGGDFTYQAVRSNAVFLFTPERPFTFAFEALVGQLWGTNPPSQAQFDAGGEGAVRGVRTGDFVDRGIFVAKGEVRVSVLEDLDVNVLWLAWWRRLELCGFVDAGDVGDNVYEVFRAPSRWKLGVGGGVRAELEALGIRPTVLRFDIAWRADHGEGEKRGKAQFYVGVNQSF
ncbi:BamA/TamA family outer membrane protein [bacterium]|nr:BamA/TamA family outer membrane protein [bacterium]